jgi:hypothetical protein
MTFWRIMQQYQCEKAERLSAMRLISASTPTPDCPDGLDQPSAAQLGRSPRAATSRADGVSGRSTRRQAHWSAARIHSPPKMPAGTGAVAFRSVFAFIESPNLQQAAFAHFRGKRSLHIPARSGCANGFVWSSVGHSFSFWEANRSSIRAPSHNSQSSRHPSSIRPATCVTTGWDRAY